MWHENPRYFADEAVKTFAHEKAADKFARQNIDKNYVVRELKYVYPARNPRGETVTIRPLPKSAVAIGDLVAVEYSHDGVSYRHEFTKHSRPLLAASIDGKQLLIVGGRFQHGPRGIVDK